MFWIAALIVGVVFALFDQVQRSQRNSTDPRRLARNTYGGKMACGTRYCDYEQVYGRKFDYETNEMIKARQQAADQYLRMRPDAFHTKQKRKKKIRWF